MAGRGGFRNTDYETVAASQTDQVMGPVGGAGDILEVIVATCTGAAVTNTVSIKDGGGSSIPLVPTNAAAGVYAIPLGMRSTGGAWKVTTAATVTVIAIGRFT